MTFNALVHDDIDVGNDGDAGRAPSPFLFDPEILSRPCKQIDARLRWRNSVFAVARKMLTEDGHRHFTLRRLSTQTNSSVQNIYNNIGTRGDVILQAVLNYNGILLALSRGESCNPYVLIINARHKEVVEYPEYARAVYDTLFDNSALNEALHSETIRLITPFVRTELVRHGSEWVNQTRLCRLLSTVVRSAAREWFDGMCSAEEMRENSLADGELCLMGALSERKGRWAESIRAASSDRLLS